jgi:hypothetical protein
LKISQSFENSEAIVKFTVLSRLAVKAVEVAGAGAVSALCAYLLGQFEHRPAPAPAPAPAVIQLSPATAEKGVQEDHTRLADLSTQVSPQPVPSAPILASATTLPKAAPAAPARRPQKSEQGARPEPKAHNGEPLAIKPVAVASNSAPKAPGQTVQPPTGGDQARAGNGGEEERPLVARLTSWFLPENDRIFGDLARPPVPVGDSSRSAM